MAENQKVTDYFALLNEERRPWLDLDALKQKYQKLTRTLHPDAQPKNSEANDFTLITEAHRVLADPRLRVRLLLELEGVEPPNKQPVPGDLAQLFPSVAKLVQETDALLTKCAAANNALSKSLLSAKVAKQLMALKTGLAELQRLESSSLDELRDLDNSWHRDRTATLGRLRETYQRLAYLARWLEQLRERDFQLAAY